MKLYSSKSLKVILVVRWILKMTCSEVTSNCTFIHAFYMSSHNRITFNNVDEQLFTIHN